MLGGLKHFMRLKCFIGMPCVVIVTVTTLTFLPCVFNGFTNFDDDAFVTGNPLIANLNRHSISRMFSTYCQNAYVPLTLLSFAADHALAGMQPAMFHTTNLLLHIANSLLVFMLVLRISGEQPVACITALLFGVHPLHVEPVAWVSARKDLLASLFMLGALISYQRYAELPNAKKYVFVVLLFALSLQAKLLAVTLPLIMLLFDWHSGRRLTRRVFVEKILFFALAALFAFVAVRGELPVQPGSAQSDAVLHLNPLFALFSAGFYLYKIFLPAGLACLYPFAPENIAAIPAGIMLKAGIALALAAGILVVGRRSKIVWLGMLFYLIMLLPYMQLIRVGQPLADRYMYLAAIGPFFLLATAGGYVYKKYIAARRAAAVLYFIGVGAIIATLASLSAKQCIVWHDSISLWNNALRLYPNQAIAHLNLGNARSESGQFKEAAAHYSDAIACSPSNTAAWFNRGVAQNSLGNLKGAYRDYSRALHLSPHHAGALYNRGKLLGLISRPEDAVADFTQLLAMVPGHVEALYNRGVAYSKLERYTDAIADFSRVVDIDPAYAPAYCSRAVMHAQQRSLQQAWQDVDACEQHGGTPSPRFLQALKELSRQEEKNMPRAETQKR